jgi:hypothetical protein
VRTFRVLAASLMSLAMIFTGTTAANSREPIRDDLHGVVWIRGTTVTLIDDKVCRAKNKNAVLNAKVNGKWKPIAKVKRYKSFKNNLCPKNRSYYAIYNFKLKIGGTADGDGRFLSLYSADGGHSDASMYGRWVYSSRADYLEAYAWQKATEVLEDLLIPDND